ncbi:hypothetical protein KC851_04020 [Candidatus Kaiserbacteria bacterium]|nr:hypothetical protein [Candidatus Kaiserbacteria bacterium]
MALNSKYKQRETGFALLMSLIVVGVIVTIGLTLLDLSVKQLNLSTNARNSEISFHAANAGAECARYVRRSFADDMEAGNDITNVSCFDQTIGSVRAIAVSDSAPITEVGLDDASDAEATVYSYYYTWGTNNDRCSVIDTLVVNADIDGDGAVVNNMPVFFLGYVSSTKDCDPGSICTVVSVRGYNQACDGGSDPTPQGYGTIEREVLIEF